jgi:hypothetical protein
MSVDSTYINEVAAFVRAEVYFATARKGVYVIDRRNKLSRPDLDLFVDPIIFTHQTLRQHLGLHTRYSPYQKRIFCPSILFVVECPLLMALVWDYAKVPAKQETQ